jgi:UDP-glucose 4-epimerase
VVFRPHNVYGERQNIGDRYRNVVGIFMNQIMQGLPMSIFGDGSQTRAFSYVGDVMPTLVDAAFRPECYNDVFNLGSDHPHSVLDLARIVAEAFGVEADIEYHPARLEAAHAWSGHEKIRRVLGYSDSTPLEEGVARMARWARAHGPRQSGDVGEIEIHRNLPASWAPRSDG